jgi:tRNA pseudouridine55 synthase
MDGIILINKPSGVSSFKTLSIVKRRLGLKKVGFLGTLDPAASGLLILLCGRATKLADKLHAENRKTYQSVFTFGIETPTLDLQSEITVKSDVIPTREQIVAVLPQMIGDLEIEVPKFSAVHIDGNRAYDLARAGIEFAAPKRVVAISRFELLEKRSPTEFFFEIECQTGTYIRSLAKLIAQKLGTVAIASVIIRTRIGEFDLENAKTPETVTAGDIVGV